jgi:hypothetical protein
MKPALSGLRRRVRALVAPVILIAPIILIGSTSPGAAEPSFTPLLGSWGGSGTYKLQDGTSEKLKCDAYYTGSGSQLGIAVRCSGQTNKIEMRSKLSSSGSALSGNWEERTYNAEGTVTGKLSDTAISLSISGVVTGTMKITFDKTRQSVAIETAGTPLKSVTVTLSRK